jgi:hypothetical protein
MPPFTSPLPSSPSLPTPSKTSVVDISALEAENRHLQQEFSRLKIELGRVNRPAISSADIQRQALEQAVSRINLSAAALGKPQAMPAHFHESEWMNGWGGQLSRAQTKLDAFLKNDRPWFGKAKRKYDEELKALSDEVAQWKAGIKKRDAQLQQMFVKLTNELEEQEHERLENKTEQLRSINNELETNALRMQQVQNLLRKHRSMQPLSGRGSIADVSFLSRGGR